MKKRIKVSEIKKMVTENSKIDKLEKLLLNVEKGVYESFGLSIPEEPLFPRFSTNEISYNFISEDGENIYGLIHIEEDSIKVYHAIEGEITNEKRVRISKNKLFSSPKYLATILTDYLSEVLGG